MELEVTSGVIAKLIDEAARAAPAECCGLLLGHGHRVVEARPAANIHPRPERNFEIDPAALIAAHRDERAGGPTLVGYYHSHPVGHAVPSATDCEHASGDTRVWAIIAEGQVTFWHDGQDGFTPLLSRRVDG